MCILTHDSFTSYVTVASVLEVSSEHNIFVVREEANISHVDQAHHQSIVRVDKADVRWMLDLICSKISCLTHCYRIVV